MRTDTTEAEREHPGLALMRTVVRDENAALAAALREFLKTGLMGFEKLENRMLVLEERLEQVERAMRLNLEQLVQLRRQFEAPPRDDWWRGEPGSDES